MTSVDAARLFRCDGIVALITGGGTGLGLMMAKALANNGAAKVYVVGRRKDRLDEAASTYPDVIVPIVGDVTCKDSLESMAKIVSEQSGHLNLLIPNSGISGPSMHDLAPGSTLSQFKAHAWASPMEDFTAVYNVNSTAVYYTILAFLELLHAGNEKGKVGDMKSQIVVTSSIAAVNRNARAGFAYISSKAAVSHMVKVLSTFMAGWGIRVNALAPGFFYSELAEPLLRGIVNEGKQMTEVGAFNRDFIPEERLGREEDIAGAILYLASKAGAYNNGHILLIDGGRIATQPSSY